MTLDRSAEGTAIKPQLERSEDGDELLPRPSRTTIVNGSEHETTSVSRELLAEVAQVNKAFAADISDELDAQRKDIDRVALAIENIQKEVTQLKEIMESIRSEANARPASSSFSRRVVDHYPVDELDLLTANITSIGAKANEVEGLKLELEMMKRRIKRMEDANTATQSTSTVAGFPPEVPRSTQSSRVTGTPVGHSQQSRTEQALLDGDEAVDRESNKLGTPLAQHGPTDQEVIASRSSEDLRDNRKRPRSSTMEEATQDEEQGAFSESDRSASTSESRASDMRKNKVQTVKKGSKRPASKPTKPYFSYEVVTIDNSQDADYKPRVRPAATSASRGSPRVRGRGRGGRPRKSRNSLQIGTPEWEKPDWIIDQPMPNNKTADGAASTKRSAGVSRRGTGGGSFSEPRRAARGQDTSSDPVGPRAPHKSSHPYPTPNGGHQADKSTPQPRGHRYRDDEGYLLTAKGTRDGRSKFWKDVFAGLRPNPKSHLNLNRSEVGNSKDKVASGAGGGGGGSGSESRHARIMQQIFPDGVEEGRRRSDLAGRVFATDRDRVGNDGVDGVDGVDGGEG